MAAKTTYETFMRAAFAVEPGGRIGAQLKELAVHHSISRGDVAGIDRSRDWVAYIASGATKLCAQASGSREQIVAFHFGGDIVSVPADAAHANLLIALLDTELLAFPAREFYDCASGENAMARALFERLPAALHRCRDKAVALGCKNALERLSGFLLTMAGRVGAADGNICRLDLPMSRRDIGDSLGLTIETISRQLGALKEAGLIETRGRSEITLLDLAALEQRAGHATLNQAKITSLGKFDLDQGAHRHAALAV